MPLPYQMQCITEYKSGATKLQLWIKKYPNDKVAEDAFTAWIETCGKLTEDPISLKDGNTKLSTHSTCTNAWHSPKIFSAHLSLYPNKKNSGINKTSSQNQFTQLGEQSFSPPTPEMSSFPKMFMESQLPVHPYTKGKVAPKTPPTIMGFP
jgi:hypothetical protein